MDYTKILPVLFLEYLAISLTKTLIPKLIVDKFEGYSYFVVGVSETVKGLLAFVSCPIFGKLSDQVGRKLCILLSMVGTTFPVCIMSFTSNVTIYVILLSLSGLFSGTFTLTFAYIADCVEKRKRAAAYGLALATFGLSFSVGPLLGSYLHENFGSRFVFYTSLVLVVLNIIYISFLLPETSKNMKSINRLELVMDYMPNKWNVFETFRIFRSDPFMSNLAAIVLLYYTSVWALVSTLMVYVTRQLNMSVLSLGWLLSGYGIATMISEGFIVRIVIPKIGEVNAVRLGLFAFTIQCLVISISSTPFWIFVSVFFSMLANLVYPSISSLVSRTVSESEQGETLGALNGIKAMTEGFGPLLFGLIMSLFENSSQPGAPYLLVGVISFWALLHSFDIDRESVIRAQQLYSKDEEHLNLLSDTEIEEDISINS